MRSQKLLCVCTVFWSCKEHLCHACVHSQCGCKGATPYPLLGHVASCLTISSPLLCHIRCECLIFTFRASFNLQLFSLPLLLTPVMLTQASSFPVVPVSIAYLMHLYKTYFGDLFCWRETFHKSASVSSFRSSFKVFVVF